MIPINNLTVISHIIPATFPREIIVAMYKVNKYAAGKSVNAKHF